MAMYNKVIMDKLAMELFGRTAYDGCSDEQQEEIDKYKNEHPNYGCNDENEDTEEGDDK